MQDKPSPVEKWSVFLGIYLLGIFFIVPWVWGNLSIYCTSYFHNRVGSIEGEVAPWLVSLNTIGLAIGVLTCGKIRHMIGLRQSLLLGILLFNGGVYLTFLAVHYSTVLLDFTLGLLPGLGMGIVQANQYTLVIRWTDHYQGLATASVESTCVLGSVFVNTIITFYVNPHNCVSNETIGGRIKIFSQPEILDKVPSAFILFGTLSLLLNCVGFLLTRQELGEDFILLSCYKKLKNRPKVDNREMTDGAPLKITSVNSSALKDYGVQYETNVDRASVKAMETKESETNDVIEVNHNEIVSVEGGKCDHLNLIISKEAQQGESPKAVQARHPTEVKHFSSIQVQDLPPKQVQESSPKELPDLSPIALPDLSPIALPDLSPIALPDLSPREVLKTRVFYALWISLAVADYTFIALTTYYKAFGLLYIHDDHFLTSVATVMCVAIALISYAGGIAVDKFGVKYAVIAFISILNIISSFFYLTPSVNNWLYLVTCAVYAAFDFGIVCVFSSCALKLWGETHLSTNYGLILSSCVITNVVLPPVVEMVILTFSWLALFSSISVSIFFSLVLCIWMIPSSKTLRTNRDG